MATDNTVESTLNSKLSAPCLKMSVELKEQERSSFEEKMIVFVTLPTGYRKCMIFHFLPLSAHYTISISSYHCGTSSFINIEES